MSAPRAALNQRRAQLLATIATERAQAAASFEVWRQPLAVLDFARGVGHFVRVHPIAVAVACASLRLLLPRRLTDLGRGWRNGRRLAAAFSVIQAAVSRRAYSNY